MHSEKNKHFYNQCAVPPDEFPLVSVVVITYNSALFVLETLASIKDQTYHNIELIVSDDASSDHTVALCQEWLEMNASRFRGTKIISSSQNTGIPGNCNRGCKACAGVWVKIIAGDDLLLPDCIELNIRFISTHPRARLVCSHAVKIDRNGLALSPETSYYKKEPESLRTWFFSLSPSGQRKFYARNPVYLVAPSFFVKKSILNSIGGFDDRLRVYEDIVLVCKTLGSGWKVHHMPVETVKYRMHSQSVSRAKSKEVQEQNLGELSFIYSHYRSKYLHWWCFWDVCAMADAWLTFDYSIRYRLKGARFFKMLNPYRIYQKIMCLRYRSHCK